MARSTATDLRRGIAKPAHIGDSRGIDSEITQPIRARLRQVSSGNTEIEQTLISVYLELTKGKLAVMRDLFARGDLAKLEDEAHSLKGASANIGAVTISQLAKQLEHTAQAPGGEQASLLDRIEAEYRKVKTYLAQLLENDH